MTIFTLARLQPFTQQKTIWVLLVCLIKMHEIILEYNEAIWLLTWQEERLVYCDLFSKSYMAEVFLAFAYGCDIATLSKHFHDELFCGVLW